VSIFSDKLTKSVSALANRSLTSIVSLVERANRDRL